MDFAVVRALEVYVGGMDASNKEPAVLDAALAAIRANSDGGALWLVSCGTQPVGKTKPPQPTAEERD